MEFVDPMIPGDASFYSWITAIEGYYPDSRWEWDVCIDELKLTQPPGATLVDVGCGSGAFLSAVSSRTEMHPIGIDISPDAIEQCRRQGFEAHNGTLDDASILPEAGVDAFSFWHVVEHVDNPLALLGHARARLKPEGKIFFSVPLSPTSSEMSGLDPLNLPPHHLTRWSATALEALAHNLGFEAVIYVPRARGLLFRTLRSLSLHAFSPFLKCSRARKAALLLGYMLRHPVQAAQDLVEQLHRQRLDGHALGDVVLVCMRRKQQGAAQGAVALKLVG